MAVQRIFGSGRPAANSELKRFIRHGQHLFIFGGFFCTITSLAALLVILLT